MEGAEADEHVLNGAARDLWQFLCAWRTENGGMAQNVIARRAGLSSSYVSEVLSGRKSPRPEAAARLIDAIRPSESHRRKAERLAEAMMDTRRPSDSFPRRTGPGQTRQVAELDDRDAFTMGVLPAVRVEANASLPRLTPFIKRPHDDEVGRMLRLGREEGSHLILLRGDAATGKSRSCWEAMRAVLGDRAVWHARAPGDPDELLTAFDRGVLSDQMVVWLDDVGPLLRGHLGRQVAKEIQTILEPRSARSLILLGSIWSGDWRGIIEEPPKAFGVRRDLNSDLFSPVVDRLLNPDHSGPRYSHKVIIVDIPSDFSHSQARAIDDDPAADPRLKLARAGDNRSVTQYLAGAPLLEHRYQTCAADGKEVLNTFMDFGRLSGVNLLPVAFLTGLRHDHREEEPPQEWQAPRRPIPEIIASLQEPDRDLPGPIIHRLGNLVTEAAPEDSFRLARHLDYLGRSTRQHIYPDPAFWRTARTVFLGANVLSSLARAAEDRQRYATAAALYAASPTSNPHRLRSLALLYARGGQYRQAVETARQAIQEGDTTPLRVLAKRGLPGYPTQDLYRLAASAGDGHAAFLLTRIYLSQGHDEEARAVAAQALRRGHDSAMREFVTSTLGESNPQHAEELFRRSPYAVDLLLRDTVPEDVVGRLAEIAINATGTAVPHWLVALRHHRQDARRPCGDRDSCTGGAPSYRAAAEHGDPRALRALADALLRTGRNADAAAAAVEAFHVGERFFGFRLLAEMPRADLGSTRPAGPIAGRLAREFALAARAEVMDEAVIGIERARTRDEIRKSRDVIVRLWWSIRLAELSQHDEANLMRRTESRLNALDAARVMTRFTERNGSRRDALSIAANSGQRGNADALADLAALRLERDDQAGAVAAANTAAAAGHCGLLHALAQLSVTNAQAESHLRRAIQAGDPWAAVALWRLTDLPARLSFGAKRLLIDGLLAGDPEPLLITAAMFDEQDRPSSAYALLTAAARHDDGRTAAALVVAEYRRGQPKVAERQAISFLERRDTRPIRSLIGIAMDLDDEDLARQLSATLGEYLTTGELLNEIRALTASGDKRRALPVLEITSARGDANSYEELARLAALAGDAQTAAQFAIYAINCGDRFIDSKEFIPEDRLTALLGEDALSRREDSNPPT